MRSLLIYRLSDGLLLCHSLGSTGDKRVLQGGHHKDLRPVEVAILGQLPVYLSSAVKHRLLIIHTVYFDHVLFSIYSVLTCTRCAQCFGLKECKLAFTERRTTDIYI